MKTHTVKAKETLSFIAKTYGTTVELLASTNGIKNPDIIFTGQVLKIPYTQYQVYNALISCIDAIEALPEFNQLVEILNDRK